MSYPSGGFPAQGGPQQQPQQGQQTQHFAPVAPQASVPGPAKPLPLGPIGALVLALLGLVAYFLTFSDRLAFGLSEHFLLIGGLLAALSLLPKGPRTLPFAALFSVVGFLGTLGDVVEASDAAGVQIILLILSIFQFLVAVAVLLLDAGILKMPAPRPAQPAQPAYGAPGQFGAQYGQPQSGGFNPNQPGQYGGPQGQPPSGPAPQGPTTYAPQQGQFHQQPPSFGQEQQGQSGQQGQEGQQ